MTNNHTNLQAVNKDGQTVSFHHTSTDSPILPAANLAQLQQIDPALVAFVVEETRLEAAARRRNASQINWFIFLEKVAGVAAGAIVAIFGFAVAGYLVLRGHDTAGAVISGTTLLGIVTVLVTRQHMTKKEPATPPKRARQARAKKTLSN